MGKANARFVVAATIDGKPVELVDHWLVLFDGQPANCQLTIKCDSAKRFSMVGLELGWGSMTRQVFYGFVERVSEINTGYVTVFCRELIAALDMPLTVMLRHPTLKQIIDAIAQQTKLAFKLPEASYINETIPCFNAQATGYAILNNAARAFKINNFIVQQLIGGSIYVGSYQDSGLVNKPITIPSELMKEHTAAKAVTLPAAPQVRPNVLANGQRISKVEFKETNMIISW